MGKRVTTPTRQVHLDFHTSEQIADVGRDFAPAQFQAALELGRVQAINVFAKCHHGWSYYPTAVGHPHPHLQKDLLGGMIEAAHAIGVQAPIYFTVGWSANDAATHPEWIGIRRDGTKMAINYDFNAPPDAPRRGTSWITLCPTGGYLDLILRQTAELCERYPVDGFWYDICACSPPCYCERCKAEMRANGDDPADEAAAARQFERAWTRLMRETAAIIQRRNPAAAIFYNGTTGVDAPDWKRAFCTRLELEDLPTTWGGYDKFPLRARYFAASGKGLIAMSGKFHTSWGEFGGFKPAAAMKAEASAMVAYGARCCFGDQLHPHGRMDPETYRLVGEAYAWVERIAEYGLDGIPCANLGLWCSRQGPHDEGVVSMLLESQLDFEVAHGDTDLSRFDAIILTGAVRLDEPRAARLRAFVAAGGGLLVLEQSGLDETGGRFVLPVGAHDPKPARYDCDYLVVADALARDMVRSPVLCYTPATRVTPDPDAEILARVREPFFSRTYGHYCSHLNTPPRGEDAEHPAALRRGRVVYLAHALGKLYHEHGAEQHRQYFRNALALVYGGPMLGVEMPSGGRVSLVHQPQRRRYVAHLLHAPPVKRGRCLVIEDMPPLRDVPVSLRVPQPVLSARLPLDDKPLAPRRDGDRLRLIVPEVRGHQIVEFAY
jgi:hypothetical protein